MICANVNHPDYKKLESMVGEIMAHRVWDKLKGEVSDVIGSNKTNTINNVRNVLGITDKLDPTADKLSELNQRLIEKLAPFGITVEIVDSIYERTGVNAVGAADTLNKVIMVAQGKAGMEALPEEASHMFIDLLGDNHPLVQRMVQLAPASQKYKDEFDTYDQIYEGDTKKIAKEIAGKLMADALIRQQEDANTPRLMRTIKMVWDKIRNMFSKVPSSAVTEEIEAVFDAAAAEVLRNDNTAMNVENLSGELYYQAEKITVAERKTQTVKNVYENAIKNLEKRIETTQRRMEKGTSEKSKTNFLATLKGLKSQLESLKDDPIQGLIIYANRAVEDLKYVQEQTIELENSGEDITAAELVRLKSYTDAYADLNDMISIFKTELSAEYLESADGKALMESINYSSGAMSTFDAMYLEMGRVVIANFLIDFSARKDLAEGNEFRLTAKDIADQLENVDKDVTWYRGMLNAMADSNDAVLALTSKVIHKKKAEVRQLATDFTYNELIDKVNALEKFQKAKGIPLENKKKLYDFMLEKSSDGKLTGRIHDINSKEGKALTALPDSDPRKVFYKFFRESYYNAQNRLPFGLDQKKDELPSILATEFDHLYEGGSIKDAAKAWIKDTTKMTVDETDYEDLTDGKHVPVKYHTSIGKGEAQVHPDHISYDLGDVLESFNTMSLNNRAMREIVNEMELIKDLVGSRAVKGKKLNEIGKATNAYKQLSDYIDAHVYGERKLKQTVKMGDKEYNISKAVDTLNKYSSLRSLSFNMFSGLSNVTYGQAMNFLEGHGGQFYSKSDLINANLDYDMSLPSILKDVNNKKPSSKINLLNIKFDTLQEFDEYGNHIKSSTAGRRIFSQGSLYFAQSAGEHMMQSTLMMAMMRNKKFKLKNGNEISLWDAYTEVDGKLVLNPDVAEQFTAEDEIDFSETMKAVSQKLHGIYNNLDAAAFQRHAVGRMAAMFRKWLLPSINRRYQLKRYDERTASVEEGIYLTMARFAFGFSKDLKQLKLNLTMKDFDKLEPWEQQNIRRAITEIAYIVGSTVLITALTALSGDDEDERNWLANMSLYQLHRFNTEAFQFLNPIDTLKILKSPAASVTTIEALFSTAWRVSADSMLWATGQEPARYKRDSGIYKKGDLKLKKKIDELIPGWKEVQSIQMPENRLAWLKWD